MPLAPDVLARYTAIGFGLPYGWKVYQRKNGLVASGPALPCGHRSVSHVYRHGDLLLTSAYLVAAIRRHVDDGI